MLGLTTYYRKSLPVLILSVFKEGSRIVHIVEDVNHEQSTSLMATARMETTHELTYSMSRAIEVTTWQSVDDVITALSVTVVVLSLDLDLFWL